MEGFQNSHQQFFAQQQELAKECIDLYQQKISLTRMQKLTPDRVELIHTCYQKIKTIVELTGHFENTLIPYLHFLEETDQNPDEIKDLTAYIQWCYMKPGYQVPLKDYSDLYNELLHHYEANQNHKKASAIRRWAVSLDTLKILMRWKTTFPSRLHTWSSSTITTLKNGFQNT